MCPHAPRVTGCLLRASTCAVERPGERQARSSLEVTHCPAPAGKSRQRRAPPACGTSPSFRPPRLWPRPRPRPHPPRPGPAPPRARPRPHVPLAGGPRPPNSPKTRRPEERTPRLRREPWCACSGSGSASERRVGGRAARSRRGCGRRGGTGRNRRPQRFRAAAGGLAAGRRLRRDGGPGRRGLSAAGTRRCEAGSR